MGAAKPAVSAPNTLPNEVSRSPAKQLARSAEMIYRGVLLQRLGQNPHIRILDNCQLTRVDSAGKVYILHTETDQQDAINASRLFIAQGRKPDSSLADQLQQANINYACIGDARRGGRIGDAVQDAYLAVQKLCNSDKSKLHNARTSA